MVSMSDIQKHVRALKEEIGHVIVGQDSVIEQLLVSLLCNSHALLEGYPGVAKTLMVRSLAETLDLRFSRIQGTPDLLPSDITGTYIIDDSKGKREFKFQPGPIFANIVLMDEINRAAPKTQSAMLEAMQEKQVTIGNSTFPLEEPFFVLATQNPIEQEGSLPLNQYVYVNGQLKTGHDLLRDAQSAPSFQQGAFTMYKLPNSSTFSLNAFGKLEPSECYFYTYPHDGDVLTLKTKTGKEITVTPNHPFLVNDNGEISWKKAEELTVGSTLVCPAKIEDKTTQTEVLTHEQTIHRLQEKYTIVSYEEVLQFKERTKNFTDFSSFIGTDFDKLRIIKQLQIKQLAQETNQTAKNQYWQMIRYLKRPTSNPAMHKILSLYFSSYPPALDQPQDFIDSLLPICINRFQTDQDLAFFLAFLLSDGCRIKGLIAAVQKNFPHALDRFIRICKEKIGVTLDISTDATSCRTAKKVSAPFSDYITLRYGINQGDVYSSGIPLWMLKFPQTYRREFLKTFISLEGCLRDSRIRISQVNKESINVLSYMLLKEDILPWFSARKRDNGKDYIITIQGEDFSRYLTHIGWLDEEKKNELILNSQTSNHSAFRIIPVPRMKIIEFVSLLGINSFHTLKTRKNLLSKQWYCGYKAVKQGKNTLSNWMFTQLLAGFREEINFRKSLDTHSLAEKDPRYLASLCGTPITTIASFLSCSKNQIWNLYSKGTAQQAVAIQTFIVDRYQTHLLQAESILHYLERLAPAEIYYDQIQQITFSPYHGDVFGLTVPGLQNYIGGYGGCGFNHNTFLLPEAQRDRFLFKIKVDYPSYEEEVQILARFAENAKTIKLHKVFTKDTLLSLQDLSRQVPIANDIKKYALDLVVATRQNKKLIEYGASPRASINLILASKARALLDGRKYVSKEDIKIMALPILRHRIIPSFEAERQGLDEDAVIRDLLKR